MKRRFKLEEQDFKIIDKVSGDLLRAEQWKLNLRPYKDACLEQWRILGWKYGFDQKTVSRENLLCTVAPEIFEAEELE